MNEVVNETGALSYYLPHQIIASLIIALLPLLIGMFLAWLIWGRRKNRVFEMEKSNAELTARINDHRN